MAKGLVNDKIVELVKTKIAAGIVPSNEELAIAIPQDAYLLFNYLLDNNITSVNEILKVNLHEATDFMPNRKQIERIIGMYIQKGEKAKLQTILDNFDYNASAANYTTSPVIHQAIIYSHTN